jgi:hypothetical protein
MASRHSQLNKLPFSNTSFQFWIFLTLENGITHSVAPTKHLEVSHNILCDWSAPPQVHPKNPVDFNIYSKNSVTSLPSQSKAKPSHLSFLLLCGLLTRSPVRCDPYESLLRYKSNAIKFRRENPICGVWVCVVLGIKLKILHMLDARQVFYHWASIQKKADMIWPLSASFPHITPLLTILHPLLKCQVHSCVRFLFLELL